MATTKRPRPLTAGDFAHVQAVVRLAGTWPTPGGHALAEYRALEERSAKVEFELRARLATYATEIRAVRDQLGLSQQAESNATKKLGHLEAEVMRLRAFASEVRAASGKLGGYW